jgi:hypothetical protein
MEPAQDRPRRFAAQREDGPATSSTRCQRTLNQGGVRDIPLAGGGG